MLPQLQMEHVFLQHMMEYGTALTHMSLQHQQIKRFTNVIAWTQNVNLVPHPSQSMETHIQLPQHTAMLQILYQMEQDIALNNAHLLGLLTMSMLASTAQQVILIATW